MCLHSIYFFVMHLIFIMKSMTLSFMVQFKLEDLKGEFLSNMVSIFKNHLSISMKFLWKIYPGKNQCFCLFFF